MRLTLRTMLAYVDEILEPADREDIAQKIADSPFATALLERIRDTTRNPKLPAPKLMEQGMGLDPNTVAEYLDNTLAGERVQEFETVCLPPQGATSETLESDVFLAEVAACHQILTMVLGHPAHVDPEMKRRMYSIIDQTQIEHAVDDPEAAELRLAPIQDGLASGSLADFEFKPRRRKPEVPEYLRQPTGGVKWKPIAAGVILALVLLVAVTMALGPLDNHHPLLGWLFHAPAEQNQVAEKPPQPVLVNSQAHPAEGLATPPMIAPPSVVIQPPVVAQGNPSQNSAQPSPLAGGSLNPQQPAVNSNSSASPEPAMNAGTSNPAVGTVPTVAPIAQSADTHPAATAPAMLVPDSTATGQLNSAAARSSTSSAPPTIVDNAHPPANADAPTPGDLAVDKTAMPGAGDVATAAAQSKPIGTFPPATKETLLFRFDNVTHQWFKLPTAAGAPLFGGNQLLVLSNCRPTLGLISSISLQVPPETVLQLEGPDAAGVLGLKLFFGRLVATTTGKNGTQLRLDFGPIQGTVTFVDSDATLAVEMHTVLPPGANPEVVDPVTTVDLYSANGQIQWTSAEGAVATLRASQRLTLPVGSNGGNSMEPQQESNLPKWISPESLSSLDERCIEQLTTSLESGKPLETALREMADRPQVEQHAFAAECLSFLGEFDPLITALNDPDRKLRWSADIAALRAALTRGPAMAAAVRESFEKLRGEDSGRQLYRMLLGYSKEQLQSGEAERLVDALDNDSLDFRELAFVNLMEITGKTHSYHPDDATSAARSQHIRQWREDLRAGAIVPHDAIPQK